MKSNDRDILRIENKFPKNLKHQHSPAKATSHNSFPKFTISDSSSGAKALMAMMAVVVQVALMALAALVALLALVALVGLVFFQICSI